MRARKLKELDLVQALNTRVVGTGGEEGVVVLAHGFGGSQSLWDHVYPSLITNHDQSHNHSELPDFRVVLFDWPGAPSTPHHLYGLAMSDLLDIDVHGGDFADKYRVASNVSIFSNVFDSFPRILLALLSQLGIRANVSFVGHSMSALIGCIASQLRPSLFRKLVLVTSSPRYLNDPGTGYVGGFELEGLEAMYEAMAANFEGWATSFASMAAGPGNHGTVEWFGKSLSGTKKEVSIEIAKGVFETDNREVLDGVMLSVGSKRSNDDHGGNGGSGGDGDGGGGGGGGGNDDDDDDGSYDNHRGHSHHHDGSHTPTLELHIIQACNDIAVPHAVNEYLRKRLSALLGHELALRHDQPGPAASTPSPVPDRSSSNGLTSDDRISSVVERPLTIYRYVSSSDRSRGTTIGSLCILNPKMSGGDGDGGGHFPQVSYPNLFNSALSSALLHHRMHHHGHHHEPETI